MAKLIYGSFTYQSDTKESLLKMIRSEMKEDENRVNPLDIFTVMRLNRQYLNYEMSKDEALALREQTYFRNLGRYCIDIKMLFSWFAVYGKAHPVSVYLADNKGNYITGYDYSVGKEKPLIFKNYKDAEAFHSEMKNAQGSDAFKWKIVVKRKFEIEVKDSE